MDEATKRQLLGIITKIPLFNTLTLYQAEKVLGLCHPARYETEQVLCEQGTPSTEMFILLSGELGISRETAHIATVTPVAPVGEMGLLTGEMRTATVTAKAPSSLLVIRRMELDVMMKRDLDIALGILRNFSQVLSQRLAHSNTTLEEQRHQAQELKRQVIEYRRRVEVLEQQTAELSQQIEGYTRRIAELEHGGGVVEPAGAGAHGPVDDRQAVAHCAERYLALLTAKAYQTAYAQLSGEARRDVPWVEYERVRQHIEALGVMQRVTLETCELQHDEDMDYYDLTYVVEFANTSGTLELYIQHENDGWKISHEIVTAAGESHTV